MLYARCVGGIHRKLTSTAPGCVLLANLVEGRSVRRAGESQLTPRTAHLRPRSALYRAPSTPYILTRSLSTAAMAGVNTAVERLSNLSIAPSASVSHGPQTSPAEWRTALSNASGAPKDFELLKTLVFKPKTAKTATTVPVVVIAREETEASASTLGKELKLKEMRLANADLLNEFFALDKDSRT